MGNEESVYRYTSIDMLMDKDRIMSAKMKVVIQNHIQELGSVPEIAKSELWISKKQLIETYLHKINTQQVKLLPIPEYIPFLVKNEIIMAFNESCLEAGLILEG